MSANLNDFGGSKLSAPQLEAGVAYDARVVSVAMLGLQAQRPYQGQEKDPAHEVAITYELLDEFMVDSEGNPDKSKPRWFTEIMPVYGMNADRAKSTQRYKAIDPTNKHGGNLMGLVNEPVLVTIVHNPKRDKPGEVWENVGGVSRMREKHAANAPELVGSPVTFDVAEPDLEQFFKLPKWLQKKAAENLEFEGSELQRLLKEAGTDGPGSGDTETAPPKGEEATAENPY